MILSPREERSHAKATRRYHWNTLPPIPDDKLTVAIPYDIHTPCLCDMHHSYVSGTLGQCGCIIQAMHAYFTASITGKNQYRRNYEQIIDILTAKGLTVQSHHIMDTTEDQMRLKTKQDRLDFHHQLEEWINNADFLIAETSFPSISVGYEISMAIHRGKPVLILYSEGDPPNLLAEHKDERIICEKYSPENLEQMIDYFLYFVKGGADSRFTFFITAKIAAYLDEVAKKAKVPKSVYLRHLIEMDMKENKFK